eukprot:gene13486-4365_t
MNEAKFVAESLDIDSVFESRGKRKRKADNKNESCGLSNEDEFKINVFYVALDSVLGRISLRFRETRNIASTFSFLWRYVEMEETKLSSTVKKFAANYATYVSPDLLEEIIQLRHLRRLKFGDYCHRIGAGPARLYHRSSILSMSYEEVLGLVSGLASVVKEQQITAKDVSSQTQQQIRELSNAVHELSQSVRNKETTSSPLRLPQLTLLEFTGRDDLDRFAEQLTNVPP